MAKTEKLRNISDFQWASACGYIQWLEVFLGLEAFNSLDVHSFAFTKQGPRKLIKRKTRVMGQLDRNCSKIERFVGERREELGDNELSIIRGMWKTSRDAMRQVEEHITAAKRLQRAMSIAIIEGQGEGQNDLPF